MKVAVLMSGGVDSTVTARLLLDQGYDVMGLTMIHFDRSVGEKARNAAGYLGIEHQIVDLNEEFTERVIDYFCSSYEKGETPNPCVECNKYIKFGRLLDIALKFECEKVATGHYAKVEYSEETKRYLLRKGVDKRKDQSYFLYGLKQEQLSRILFPLGDFTKDEVRQIARNKGMKVAESKESQEICFIADDYRDFISDKVNYSAGEVVDLEDNLLGTHRGIPFYTIGQRKGLGISAGRPVYVLEIDRKNNRIVVDDEKHLFKKSLYSTENNFILIDGLKEPMRVEAKVRYRAPFAPATIYRENDLVKVEFDEPQRAITRGQSVVFYQGEYVVGGGIII